MSKVAIITDSTANLSREFLNVNPHIRVVPLCILANDKVYKEGIDINIDGFIKIMKDGSIDVKTSQPSVQDFISVYKELKEEGYDYGIALHIGAGLSGTLQNSLASADMEDFKLYYIDTKLGSYPLKKVIEYGNELIKNKKFEIHEVLKKIEIYASNYKLYFIPENLKQLKKSGRAKLSQLVITSVLNIKLILGFDDEGLFEVKEKIRTEKKALNYLEHLLLEEINKRFITEVGIMHLEKEELALKLQNELSQKYPNIDFVIEDFIPAAAVHGGLGLIAISF